MVNDVHTGRALPGWLLRSAMIATAVVASAFVSTTALAQPRPHAAITPPSAPAPGDPGELQVTGADASRAPIVTVDVAIPADAAGGTLAADAFSVAVDKTASTVTVDRVPASALEVVLVIDVSGSMSEGNAIGAAKAAAASFLENLPAEAAVGIVSFADSVSLISPLTADRASLTAAIDRLTARGETALHDALVFAPTLFSGVTTDRQIVLLSDGGDTVSANPLSAAIDRLAGIRTSAIELVSSEANQAALAQVTSSTGGTLSSVGDPAALDGLFQEIVDTLIHRYRLTFSTDATGPAEVAISVRTSDGILRAIQTIALPDVPPSPTATDPAPTTTPSTTPASAAPVASGAGEIAVPVAQPPLVATSPRSRNSGTLLVLGAGAIFLALALLTALALPWAGQRKKAKPLLVAPSAGSIIAAGPRPASASLADRLTDAADRMLERSDRKRGLAAALDVAAINLRPGEFVVIVGVAAGVSGLLLGASMGRPGVILGLVGVPLVARLVITGRADRRRERFAQQLPDVLELMVSALRGGYALPQALDAATTQSAEPAKTELHRVQLEVRVGRDPAEALTACADRMRSKDFTWVVSAIQINREIGGELAGVLAKVAETVRERQRLARQIDTLTAEGRLSAYVLTALPFVVGGFTLVTNPSFFDPMKESPGPALLGIGAGLMAIGWIWMRRLIRTEI